MSLLFINIIFFIFSLFILGKIISYCIYEIKTEKNVFGGTFIIVFSAFSLIFSNIMVWIY